MLTSPLWLWACRVPQTIVIEPVDRDPTTTACTTGTCIDDPAGEDVRNGWVNVAVDPTGGAWVIYAQADGPDVTDVYLARSPAPGAPLSEPVPVPVAEPPSVGATEKPSLAVDGERIAVTYTGRGPYRHGDASVLYAQVGGWDESGAVFEAPRIVDRVDPERDPPDLVFEQARAALSPSGELWLLWKRQRYGVEDQVYRAREAEDFAPLPLSDALPTNHDCSPPDLRFGYSGSLRVALRGNVGGWLQTLAVAVDPADGSAEVVQVSSDAWAYDPDICPEDGPRIAELADGTVYAAWMAPFDGTWRLLSAWSADGGRTFGPPGLDHEGDVGLGQTWVAVAPTEAGPFHTAVEGLDRRTRVLTRDSPNAAALERWLVGADGSDLVDVEVASGHGRSVAVGIGEDRVLWLIDL
jgi:hypothetical protein